MKVKLKKQLFVMALVGAVATCPSITASTPGYTPGTSAVAATLRDIYDPTIFNQMVQERAIESNAFLASGIMISDASINAIAASPGHIADLPFFQGLTNDEPNYVNDDPSTKAVPARIASAKQVCAKVHSHKSWSTMDLARELGSADPLAAIIDRIGHYWSVNMNKRLIAAATGVLADNDANDADDMISDISIAAGNDALDANRVSASAIVTAAGTMGDHSASLTGIAMHSVIYHNLQKKQLLATIRDSDNNIQFETLLGKYRVVVDDSLVPVDAATNGKIYTSILFATGAFAYGSGSPMVPSELERAPDVGNGGGQDIIHSRNTEIIHPYGFAYSDTAIAGISATYAELRAAGTWNRVYNNRKNVGLAFLKSNG